MQQFHGAALWHLGGRSFGNCCCLAELIGTHVSARDMSEKLAFLLQHDASTDTVHLEYSDVHEPS